MSLSLSKAAACGAIVMSTVADAGFYSLSIKRTTAGIYWNDPGVLQQNHGPHVQAVLGSSFSHPTLQKDAGAFPSVSKNARTEKVYQGMTLAHDDDDDVDAWFFSLYTTKVGVGNPPMIMTATVDNSWSTFFVPSANCSFDPHEFKYCNNHPMYNSSLSSTYQSHLDPASVLYVGLHTEGNVSQDSIHVAGMEIKEQLFEEATMWHPDAGTADDLFDTALGLSLFPSRSSNGRNDFIAASPFQNMVQQKLLDCNIFSLKLGRTDQDAGELVLGGLSEELKGLDMIEVPLNHSQNSSGHVWNYYAMNGWQISVTGMSFSPNGSKNATAVLKTPQIAVISSSFPWIGIPSDVTKKIHKVIGMKYTFDWIECDKRRELPNWTIVFGPHGQSITLSPWDYLIEVYDKVFKQLKCVSAFFPLGEYGDEGFIILGQPFLNGLYSVFDADRKSISFANRPL
ncbi:aspartic peptidase domain-containing protein [Pyrenochaeta sp. MPI-SDFR-AT-0127]|nr:aspartic peptidase domain-containing protein [Pyrenochaeta sp. MPI-SDFR-AT-0127]